ncbi:Uncharacterised protein [uncultured archaeon]|nr:Uncharacterised protein [uncultured archaeon]
MITCQSETILSLRAQVSSNLALRYSADDLFDYINNLNESRIVLDFSGIESITRSFAHQYILNKSKSNKQIVECDVPINIKPMFELVERQHSNQRREAIIAI